jgi:VRR-NUC domain
LAPIPSQAGPAPARALGPRRSCSPTYDPERSVGVGCWERAQPYTVLAVQDMDWIEIVGARPIGERRLSATARKQPKYGPASAVAHIEFALRRWDGPVGDWSEHFGKRRGQVHSLDGTAPLRSCQEVEVAKRLRKVRDRAYWFSAYAPARVPATWRQRISSPKGGMPDVVAWNDGDPLGSAIFIECKGRVESFGEAQEDWVWAACRAGVRVTQIAVSVRPF